MGKVALKHKKDDGCKVQYRVCAVPNPKGGHACYAGRAVMKKASLRTIAEQMEREGSKYAQYEILGIAEQMIDVIIDRLRHGETVDFGSMMRIRPSVKGRFESETDEFDTKRHVLEVVVTAGAQLRSALEGVAAEKVDAVVYPEIKSAEVTSGAGVTIVEVYGTRLYCKDFEREAKWILKVGDLATKVSPLMQKPNGRRVTFSFPHAQYPLGTEATLALQLANGRTTSVVLTFV
jgi:hypothetical protein